MNAVEADTNSSLSGLTIRQLCAWFEENGREQGKPVFWGVSIDIAPGSIMGVAGPNGSGKTTLIRCIAGLHEWRTGEIKIDGQALGAQRLGFVPQAYVESFYPWASLLKNITMISGASRDHATAVAREFEVSLNLGLRPPQ